MVKSRIGRAHPAGPRNEDDRNADDDDDDHDGERSDVISVSASDFDLASSIDDRNGLSVPRGASSWIEGSGEGDAVQLDSHPPARYPKAVRRQGLHRVSGAHTVRTRAYQPRRQEEYDDGDMAHI